MYIYGIHGNLILVVTAHNLAKYTHTKSPSVAGSSRSGYLIQSLQSITRHNTIASSLCLR